MHVRPSQTNPYAQLDAMNAAQKAAAKQAAERTRKKLWQFASALSGEAEVQEGIARLEANEGPGGTAQQQSRRDARTPGTLQSEDTRNSISDWA